MTTEGPSTIITRRGLLTTGAATAILGAAVGRPEPHRVVAPARTHDLEPAGPQRRAPGRRPHLQFGKNAATEVVMSWHTTAAVSNPRVMLGTPTSVSAAPLAEPRTYRDAKSGTEVRINLARVTIFTPDTDYVYAAAHDGTTPALGTSAPCRRAQPLRFTSFGDQSTPTLEKLASGGYGTAHRLARAATHHGRDRATGPAVQSGQRDFCYANLAVDRIRTWSDSFENNTRSARYRRGCRRPAITRTKWERAIGTPRIGVLRFTRFRVQPGDPARSRTLTAGSVRVVSPNNDDVAFQDGGNFYVHGYSTEQQKRWLAAEHSDARRDPNVELARGVYASDDDLHRHKATAPFGHPQDGCRCSTTTRSIWSCAAKSTTTNGPSRSKDTSNAPRTPIPVDTRSDVIDTTAEQCTSSSGRRFVIHPTAFSSRGRVPRAGRVGAFDPTLGCRSRFT